MVRQLMHALAAAIIFCSIPQCTLAQDITSLILIPSLTSIEVSWGVDDTPQSIDNFRISWNFNFTTVNKDVRTYTIINLGPCDEQNITVSPRSAANQVVGEQGKGTVSTQTEVPPPVTGLQVAVVEARALGLQWERPDTTCPVVMYTVTYNGEHLWGPPGNDSGVLAVGGDGAYNSTTVRFLLTGLTPYSEYVVTVQAATEAGNSSLEALLQQTDEAPPTVPRNLTAITQGDANIEVTWTPPAEANGILGNYTVAWYNNQTLVEQAITAASSFTIREMEAGGADWVTVVATTGGGDSAAALAAIQPVTCKLPFALLRGRCVTVETVSRGTWPEMRNLCGQMGGHLVKVSSADFMADLVHFIIDQALANHDYWIGATDETESGLWEWLDGSPVRLGTPFWGDDDDQIQHPRNVYNTNYGFLASYDYFFMHDVGSNFSMTAAAVCEQGVIG